MIPDRDYYEDATGKLTTDAAKAVAQVAVKGCFLDERIARRFGITDILVSVNEPGAVRRVTGPGESSVKIRKAEEASTEKPAKEPEAAEAAPKGEAASPEKEKLKTEAKQTPAAKKGATKNEQVR
jgi:hypothetical protein